MVDQETGLVANGNTKNIIYESFKTSDNITTELAKSYNKGRLDLIDSESKKEILRFY